jgi:hypothetical protein
MRNKERFLKCSVFLRSLLTLLLTLAVSGCIHQSGPQPHTSHGAACVSFPHLKLGTKEYVQSINLTIQGGRIIAINHLLNDWSMEVTWDNPELLFLNMEAGHFISGLGNLSQLDNFITVEPGDHFTLTGTVSTETANPLKSIETNYFVPQKDFILRPTKDR